MTEQDNTPQVAHVACMKWGSRYGADFVTRLYSSLTRNLSLPLHLVCYTDDPTGIPDEIECYPLPEINLPEIVRWRPWRKISLWKKDLPGFNVGDQVLFLDLDIVITGPMDEFFTFAPGKLCAIENWTQMGQGIGNTTCYRWTVGQHTFLYDDLNNDPDKVLANHRISQQYISNSVDEMVFWPNEWCLSFKHNLIPRFPMNWFKVPELPEGTKLVGFTGKPDPDDAVIGKWPEENPIKRIYKKVLPTPWIDEHWR